MMISPMCYIEDHKNDSIEQLIAERKSLTKEIEKLEKIVFSKDKSGDEWRYNPGPDVEYQVNLKYLSELCNYISKRYNQEYE